MNISTKYNFKNETNFSKATVDEMNFEQIQKNTVEKVYCRAQREVCDWGSFSKVSEEFSEPDGKKIFKLYITPSPDNKKPTTRILQMSAESPFSTTFFSADILRGTKDDILKFLSDENNLKQISGYAALLSQRIEQE